MYIYGDYGGECVEAYFYVLLEEYKVVQFSVQFGDMDLKNVCPLIQEFKFWQSIPRN